MANPIKRLNYFTGQFLEEPDFKAEQLYHERMRRMLAFATYTPGILNGLALTKIDGGHVLVQKGVALDALENMADGDQESRTIVITADKIINLRTGPDGRGFSDGDNVFLYLSFREDPTDGDVPKNTRIQLREEVLTEKDTGTGFTLNTNLNILIGKVSLHPPGDMTIVPPASNNRMLATLRISGSGPAPGATLVSISVTPAPVILNVGDSQPFHATGTFTDASTRTLNSSDGLLWSSSNAGVISIYTNTGISTALSAGSSIITAKVGTITGTSNVTVQPAVVQPVIDFLSPPAQATGAFVEIHGQNLHDTVTPPAVRLVKGAIVKTGVSPIIRPNQQGRQIVRFTVPSRAGTPWGVNESVTLEVQRGSGIATKPFQYDD